MRGFETNKFMVYEWKLVICIDKQEEQGQDLAPLPRGEVRVQDPRPGQDEEARGQAHHGLSNQQL